MDQWHVSLNYNKRIISYKHRNQSSVSTIIEEKGRIEDLNCEECATICSSVKYWVESYSFSKAGRKLVGKSIKMQI